jgi:hypothetical protein
MIPTREAIERVRKTAPLARFLLIFNDRGLEWFSAFVMTGWGLVLLAPGSTLSGPQYKSFDRFGMTEDAWAGVFLAIGLARLVALYINGNWPRSPHIRMLGSLFGAISWMQVGYLLASTYPETGILNTGVAVYLPLAIADFIGIARASFDARYHRT